MVQLIWAVIFQDILRTLYQFKFDIIYSFYFILMCYIMKKETEFINSA
jgi:hypothetical protein